jgi:hypothetical protein
MTPTDLIKMALRQIGVLGRGQSASDEQLNDALTLTNMMLGQWAKKRWLVFHLLEIYTSGTGSNYYTLGPGDLTWDSGGSWDQSGLSLDQSLRVNRVEKAFVRMNAGATNQVDLPLRVVKSAEDWSTIPVKNVSSGFPMAVFLDAGYPVSTLEVWPAPSSTYEIHLLILNPLIRVDRLNVDINLPDEYQDAVFWNLCARLLNSYRKPSDPYIMAQAQGALSTVKAANLQIPLLRIPDAITGGYPYNIYTDGYA